MSTGGIPRFGSLSGQSRRPDVPSGLAAQLGGASMMPTIGGQSSFQPMQMSAASMPDMSGGRIPVFGGGSTDMSKLMSAPSTTASSIDWGVGPGQRNPYLAENWNVYKNTEEGKAAIEAASQKKREEYFAMLEPTGGVLNGHYVGGWGPNGYTGPLDQSQYGNGSSVSSAAAQKDAEAFIKSLFG